MYAVAAVTVKAGLIAWKGARILLQLLLLLLLLLLQLLLLHQQPAVSLGDCCRHCCTPQAPCQHCKEPEQAAPPLLPVLR